MPRISDSDLCRLSTRARPGHRAVSIRINCVLVFFSVLSGDSDDSDASDSNSHLIISISVQTLFTADERAMKVVQCKAISVQFHETSATLHMNEVYSSNESPSYQANHLC